MLRSSAKWKAGLYRRSTGCDQSTGRSRGSGGGRRAESGRRPRGGPQDLLRLDEVGGLAVAPHAARVVARAGVVGRRESRARWQQPPLRVATLGAMETKPSTMGRMKASQPDTEVSGRASASLKKRVSAVRRSGCAAAPRSSAPAPAAGGEVRRVGEVEVLRRGNVLSISRYSRSSSCRAGGAPRSAANGSTRTSAAEHVVVEQLADDVRAGDDEDVGAGEQCDPDHAEDRHRLAQLAVARHRRQLRERTHPSRSAAAAAPSWPSASAYSSAVVRPRARDLGPRGQHQISQRSQISRRQRDQARSPAPARRWAQSQLRSALCSAAAAAGSGAVLAASACQPHPDRQLTSGGLRNCPNKLCGAALAGALPGTARLPAFSMTRG